MFKIDQWTQIEMEEYNGTYSLTQGYVGKDGAFKPKFVKEEFGKGNEKTIPKRIPLGDKDTTIAALEHLLKELQGDVPF
jgi:hypothetical protein